MSVELVVANSAAIETQTLAELESEIQNGFRSAARALTTRKNERLYRETDATFDAYLKRKWNISRQHAFRMIDAEKVVAACFEDGRASRPLTEAEARPLVRLYKNAENPVQAVQDAWDAAERNSASFRPSAKLLNEVVAQRIPVVKRIEDADDAEDAEIVQTPLEISLEILGVAMRALSAARNATNSDVTEFDSRALSAVLDSMSHEISAFRAALDTASAFRAALERA